MCIVIDTNLISCVFQENNSNHLEFKPILNWLLNNRKAKMVYGGTKYKKELKRMNENYHHILKLLHDTNQFCEINEELVDDYERLLEKNCKKNNFNDKHIISIVVISNCNLICSEDINARSRIKNNNCYPKKINSPLLYTGKKNKELLNDRNIVKLKNTQVNKKDTSFKYEPKCLSNKIHCDCKNI